jgi:glycine/D-amino acid oxidase-like deaminating enzyme
MRIAIFGAGLAGLSTAWHLLSETKAAVTIDIYDPLPIGGGVSGLSSGLLYPYPGKHSRKIKDAEVKMDAAHELLSEASRSIGKPLVLSRGILRPALSPSQIQDFKKCHEDHKSDTEWWPKEKCEQEIKGLILQERQAGGLFIKSGLTLDIPLYLEGLWQACALLGTQFVQTAVIPEKKFHTYDRVIFAVGASIKEIKALEKLPISSVKGQVLVVEWPQNLPPLPFSLVSEGYIIMEKERKSCVIGATYERSFTSKEPDEKIAKEEIYKKVLPLFPQLREAKIITCKAGIRAAADHHLPLVGRISDKFWFVTGLGSKGLLYHGWLGRHLSRAVLNDVESFIPPLVHYKFN